MPSSSSSSLRVHQNLTYDYDPQAEQELCVYQDTLVPPGITFTIVHHFTRSSMYSSTHFIPKHIITYVLIHINTRCERTFMLHNHEYVTKLRIHNKTTNLYL